MAVAFSPAVDAWATAALPREQAELLTEQALLLQIQRQEASHLTEGLAAVAAGIFATILADRMFDIGEDAIDKEYEIRERIFVLQSQYINHWGGTIAPQAASVAATIFAQGAPGANYAGILADFTTESNALGNGAENGIDSLNERNRTDCGQRGCTNDAQMSAPIANVQATHYLYRHQERRRYEIDDEYRRLASSTFRGLEAKPDQAFSLLANAASLYGAIGQAANNAGSGAASTAGGFFGYAAGVL